MTHNWFLNQDNFNFNSNVAFLKNHATPTINDQAQPVFCFSHVPKTAGTSMELILAKNYLLSEVLHVNAPDLNLQPRLLNLKKNLPKLICGHHPLHGLLYQLLPEQPIFHLTQLRDPIDRVLSYYNYVQGKKDHPLHQQSTGKSIQDFLNLNPSPELANGQAKRFSGFLHSGETDDETLFKVAADTLSQCFSLVLTTCLFDEGLLLLKKRTGLKDIYYSRHNVSKRFISRQELGEEELAMIVSSNQADIKLFNWARENCLQMIKNELSHEDINDFKTNNLKWAGLIQS